jgi:hypothetical protein
MTSDKNPSLPRREFLGAGAAALAAGTLAPSARAEPGNTLRLLGVAG